ncbi:bacillithiol biosynthesis cysteine-adding enzyme BshC [Paenibacillus sp. MBLB4367]|uniref:bacillithiol biosynthesis cysteine-adding enzyme BshC n=1 Tax=Paenibacillus sp. MBLB4367 TaxID=3384767 RepID=UPI00390806F4
MKIETVRWPKSQPLAEQYTSALEDVQTLYDYAPEAWTERAEWLDNGRTTGVSRAELTELLLAFNEKMENAPEAIENIRLLRDPRTLVVVGGQQAGLFTGPLLVVYKAITVLQAAREASSRLNRPVVPVFWIAGEDHDFDEVNHTYVLNAQQSLEKIQISHPTGIRTSISRLEIPEWNEAVNQLGSLLPDTEFKAPLLDKLRAFADRSDTLVAFFARIIADLFGRHGLVLLDSDDPDLRKLEGPMFRQILKSHRDIQDAVKAGMARVEALGYRPQAETAENSANLFLYREDGERVLLLAEEDEFTDRKKQFRIGMEELLQWTEQSPERFSNNVMTRPAMQDFVLPVLGVVLGPGEIAYWSQLKGVFHALGMRMPVIVPRQEYTLLEGTLVKYMAKYEFSFEDALARFDEKKNEWLKGQDELRIEERFDEIVTKFHDMYAPLVEDIAGINAGLRKLGETNMQKISEQIGFLKAKAIDARQSQHESAVRQLDRIKLTISPIGKLQERVYNVYAYLNKYGDSWLHVLAETPYESDGFHRVVHL